MRTLTDVIDWLKRVDEVSLLEILQISSEELVDRFTDKIEDNYDELREDLDSDEEEDV